MTYKPRAGYTLVHGIILKQKNDSKQSSALMELIGETRCLCVCICNDNDNPEETSVELLYDTFTERDDAMELAETMFEGVLQYDDPEILLKDYYQMLSERITGTLKDKLEHCAEHRH
jgi:hypothetical protein